ncbi:hypothetical protein [Plantactinospora sp. WMMB782]|uniref:hypothetical protein n=1 Tax=Plantactinospora sp. WMMB782 TaxID=3404121 RepID=UPI003B963C1C
MAHDAERGCSEDEQDSLLGDHGPVSPLGPVGRFRWVCGASAALPAGPLAGSSARPGAEPGTAGRADGPDEPPPAAAAGDPSDAALPTARSGTGPAPEARSGTRPEPAATDDQAGVFRPGEPGEGAGLAAAPGDPEQAGPDPGRPVDRSRLVPRPRPGEPDGDDLDRPARAAGPAETSTVQADGRTPGCQTELPGWAGAHRHGAVRPSRRSVRRDRPPRRWC